MKRFVALAALVCMLVACGIDGPRIDVFTAAAEGNVAELEKHIAAGTDLNAREQTVGSTPLIMAAVFGHTDAVKLLVEQGVDLDVKNNEGSTAVMTATFFGHPNTLKVLLEAGADPNIPGGTGATPLEAAAAPWGPEIEGIYQFLASALQMEIDMESIKSLRPEIAELLKKHGAKTSAEL